MPETEVKARLLAYIRAELLNNPTYPIGDDTPLITGGLIDSFSLAQVGVFIEDAFGVYIPDTELTARGMDTVALMSARVVAGLPRP